MIIEINNKTTVIVRIKPLYFSVLIKKEYGFLRFISEKGSGFWSEHKVDKNNLILSSKQGWDNAHKYCL